LLSTLTVINTNDSGVGSLRQALADANDADEIEFNLGAGSHTITLSSGQLVISHDLTINGPGADQLTIS
jgi:hypothetical protein